MIHSEYLPTKVNLGPWVTAYTLEHLRRETSARFILPVCSIATPYAELAKLGDWLLPPLFSEAMDDDLKQRIVARIEYCFPCYGADDANRQRLDVIELPCGDLPATGTDSILAFSVDTAVEEHGPHLPLATDTIQSYSVLNALAGEFESLEVCKPLEYGQMTWGLPFGFSIDLTAELLTPYVRGYVDALVAWKQPSAVYVVDVHGSIKHRQAITAGLDASRFDCWAFRWLHEPLAEFASARGDQHAGGVETALVQRVSNGLLDPDWWPERIDEIASQQMQFEKAVELTPELEAFAKHVHENSLNGIVGDIYNFRSLDADVMFQRMLDLARIDGQQLRDGSTAKNAGRSLW